MEAINLKLLQLEIKKIFFTYNNWVIFIAVVLSQVILCSISTPQYNFQTKQYNDRYHVYLSDFGGKITEKKQHNIIREQERIEDAEKDFLELFSKLYNGEIASDEYDLKLDSYKNLYEDKMAFQQILNQYDYAAEDPENRYIMDENGWYVILQDNNINFLLLFCIIYMVTQVFCPEYETEMYNILSCSKNGKKPLAFSKIFIGMIFTALFFLISEIIKVLSVWNEFGLYNNEYPLQSISYFYACPYDITIGQGFIIICTLKLLSFVVIGAITATISVIIKKSMPTFFISAIVTLSPYFLFDIKKILYFIPYLGFMMSGYYFRGIDDVTSDDMLSEAVPIPFKIVICQCFFCILLLFIFISLIIGCWNNRPLIRRKK